MKFDVNRRPLYRAVTRDGFILHEGDDLRYANDHARAASRSLSERVCVRRLSWEDGWEYLPFKRGLCFDAGVKR